MIRNEKIVFTGKLDTLLRKEAHSLVFALGGTPQAVVSKDTTILVVGKANLDLFNEDPRSRKMKKAELLQKAGRPIRILSEEEFLEEVSLQISQLLVPIQKRA